MVLASQRTLVCIGGTGIVNQAVTLSLTVSYIALQLAVFFRGQTAVAGFVYLGCRVILADGEFLVRTFDTLLDTTTRQQKTRDDGQQTKGKYVLITPQ